MDQNVSAEAQKKLARMRREYAYWLGNELNDLADQVHHQSNPVVDGAAWRPVCERLHRLAGSAGTFGFEAVGEACRLLERRLERLLESPSSADASAFLRELQDLRREAESLQPTRPLRALETIRLGRSGVVTDHERPLIYVLEDDEKAGQHLCQMLESFHYRAQLFTDGDDLERACDRQRPDTLILELHLENQGGASGLAIAETIQSRLEAPLPLFVTSESQDFDIQLRAVRAGVVGFISQPLEPIRLADMLETQLRQHRMPPPRVLMVDDDETMLAYHRLVLEEVGFMVMTLGDPAQTLDALDSFAPDVLVLDVRMPRCSGPELAQIVRFHRRWLQVPIVYLSASDDADAQLEAMTKAGDDFMAKPIAPEALVAAVTSRARRSRTLAVALTRDGLTGLLKHADVKERLMSAMAQSRRRQASLCAVMLDIDHFKRVNDSHGHLVGDEVIRALANLLRRRLRESDLIGRYGGEEFLLVLNDCAESQAAEILDELREAFSALTFSADGERFACTFSAGVTEMRDDHDVGSLINEADQNLYRAKSAGRNRVMSAGQTRH
ncbi:MULTISPECIES: diguanylate cyclase [unclassified Modicisalibacter]|uniref:GGDEF domain-containing response regulator n=1 Tax=unclassified Modicisalibacter TaxID=2679913 RepID=UPI001CCA023D|nr:MULTISPECIES: diguanylate cyclase [unclassified Modicisalibacter]MBZ9559963.1 diguanylate cyclase [Modicisalibacter sp. R2A 31.J]MBZ9575871.1 diguanylate cyclase [Modicisalibacter sp. MOD 31.J]